MIPKYDITVLCGGPSSEREVSILSGTAIADALKHKGHGVTMADISPDDTSSLDRQGADIVFIALHGDFGESGEVQRLCEQRGVIYTGSGPEASRVGIDKILSKQCFREAGIPTPDWMTYHHGEDTAAAIKWFNLQEPPIVVKPIDGGSSVDVFITYMPDRFERAIEDLAVKYGKVMIEKFVAGREITVGILGGKPLPIIEIIPVKREFYDYFAKYSDDSQTQYSFDLPIPDKFYKAIQRYAVDAYNAIGCRDFARVDFMLCDDFVPEALEINTIPGFTSHSLLPKAAKHAGIGFGDLVESIVEMAMSRSTVAKA